MEQKAKQLKILKLLSKYKIEEHYYNEKGYEFLEIGDTYYKISNSTSDHYIALQIGNNTEIIFFGGCSLSFDNNDNDFVEFINKLDKILKNELFVVSICSSTIGNISIFINSEVINLYELLKKNNINLRKIKKEIVIVKTIKWDFEIVKDIRI